MVKILSLFWVNIELALLSLVGEEYLGSYLDNKTRYLFSFISKKELTISSVTVQEQWLSSVVAGGNVSLLSAILIGARPILSPACGGLTHCCLPGRPLVTEIIEGDIHPLPYNTDSRL